VNETLFYIFGIALVVSAVGVAAVGLRFENFPPTRGILALTILYFAALVGATAAFAVLNARDEEEHREAEQAAETTTTGAETTSTAPSQAGGGGETIKLAASPTDIAYDTDSLKAKAGNVTIDFNNPNPTLPHDVCVDDPSGSELGCTDQITNSSTALSLDNLKPGKYTFFCSVPGHEEAGMKGTLTVQ
jgi:uncharacterized cupredoxin-like copper-binding protein